MQLEKTGELTPTEIQTLAQAGVIPKDTPAAVVKVFAVACQQHGLSPFKKEIYLVGYGGKYSTIVGIDGLRAKADRTGQLAGKDDAKFDVMPDGSFKTSAQLLAEKKRPTTCTVTVYRAIAGMRCPFTKTVLFAEYCPANNSGKWATMPFNMIEKCAEAHALRMGFASETAGLNIEEEVPAIQDVTIQSAKAVIKNADQTANVQIEANLHEDYISEVESCASIADLEAIWKRQSPNLSGASKDQYAKLVTAKKQQLTNGAK
jgi:phage recombination protein Bet